MSSAIRLPWETFKTDFIEAGLPAGLTIQDTARLRLFVADSGSTVGIEYPVDRASPEPVSPMRQLAVGTAVEGDEKWVRLATPVAALHREFFYFALGVADLVSEGLAPTDAIEKALGSWRRLLQGAARLSGEEEVGLVGELLLLQRLVERQGPGAAAWWTAAGPSASATGRSDPHDFRFGNCEIEVKTTRSAARTHVIHGLKQLEPSPGLSLFVLSVQVEPAGGADGFTLPELLRAVRGGMAGGGALARFEDILEKRTSYRDGDAPLYPDRFRLRAPLLLVPVDPAFPRLTRDSLQSIVASEALPRLSDVQYRVSLDGMGWVDGSPEFLAVIR